MKKIQESQVCEIEARSISHQIHTSTTNFKIWNKDCDTDIEQGISSLSASTHVRHVLKNVSCRAKPSEILAIVGPSGAGKSTLLEILAGKLTPSSSSSSSTSTSSILINGAPISKTHLKKISGYVTQADLLFPLLTVHETLLFSAKFRLGQHHAQLVDSLITELGLAHVSDVRVGSTDGKIRGISGGERRRVSIGVEVVHDPRVLILDEPTSGLDSASAMQVVEMVKRMAEGKGRTVVMSIHQPGARIVKMLDRVLVMAEGLVVCCGSVEELGRRVREVGIEVPGNVNVVEFAIDSIEAMMRGKVVKEREVEERGRRGRSTLQQLFLQHNKVVNEEEDDDLAPAKGTTFNLSCDYINNRFTETSILAHRFLKNVFRTRELFLCRTIQMFVSGLILGSIFFNLKFDQKGAGERVGLFAFILTFLLSSTTEALPIFLQEREILMKETSSGTYRVSSYVIANGLVFFPFLLVLSLLFSTPVYWLVGLNPTLYSFLFFVLLIWLILYTANSVVVCFSALVPNFIVGNSVISGVMGSFFLFSGYFITKEAMPSYWVFMHYISLFKYPFEGLLVNEFATEGRCLQYEMGVCLLDGERLLKEEGFGEVRRWRAVVVMVGFILGFRVLSYVILRVRSELNQKGGIKSFGLKNSDSLASR